MTVWATADQVFETTQKTASTEAIAVAHVIVELFAGTTTLSSDEGLISSKNLRRLRQAVAFQAVWLDAHPGVLEAMDVEGISQDGLSAQYARANAHLLAPLAARLIDRLSWKAQIRVGRGNWSRRRVSDRGDRDSAVRDDQYFWTPLPFGSSPPPGH